MRGIARYQHERGQAVASAPARPPDSRVSPRRANVLTAPRPGRCCWRWSSLTAPRWSRWLRRPAARGGAAGATRASPRAAAASRTRRRGSRDRAQINVKLFFQAADRPGLVIEERDGAVLERPVASQLKAVVEELLAGSQSGLLPTPGARRRACSRCS